MFASFCEREEKKENVLICERARFNLNDSQDY